MLRRGQLMAALIAAAVPLSAGWAHAQAGPGNLPPGAYSPQATLQNFEDMESSGPSARKPKDDAELLKEAKRKVADADPRVRVDGLEKLRYVGDSAEANEILFRGLDDLDVRVRIKAIDVLGARSNHDAVPLMAQDLFLRETPPIEKLHLVAALGRIGDARGTLPVIEYLDQTDDTDSRGTAVFALGEIGDPRANDKLVEVVRNDQSPMVRKLAQEALEKIDGELPNRHSEEVAQEKTRELQTADQRLEKLRLYDQQVHAEEYGEAH
ncbi:MAG TPA: HEAT repeat domain-containing protein [Candidatus Binataceae bacterium]|nr:HEAT repeat domain-containing protein [Candidatus Binataceae bacterium]